MRFVALLVIVSIAVMISVTNGKPAKTTIEVAAETPCVVAPSASTSKTYRLELVTSEQSFPETKQLCEGKGGHLMEKTISKDNKAVNHDEIMEQVNKDVVEYWIAITDFALEGSWVGLRSGQSTTLDGTTLLAWETNKPSTDTDNSCARISHVTDKVVDVPCEWFGKGICEIEQ